MAIKKIGKYWYMFFTAPDGTRIRKTTRTTIKSKAQEYHDKYKNSLYDVAYLNKKEVRTFEEMMVIFLQDGKGQKDFKTKQRHTQYFLEHFSGRDIATIGNDELAEALPVNVSNATKNRYRSSILRAFKLAYKRNWIDRVPYIERFKEPKVRVRWLTKPEANRLVNNLQLKWMQWLVKIALLTGAREGELFKLQWHFVNLETGIAIITESKSGKARTLILNDEAVEILKSIPRISKYVFTRPSGKQLTDIDHRDFKRALKLSGIENFKFHDLRHTWASWHAQSGTPLYTLKELGGWESLDMVKKYAHLSTEHLKPHGETVKFLAKSEQADKKNDNHNLGRDVDYQGKELAPPTGLEPVTYGLTVRHANPIIH